MLLRIPSLSESVLDFPRTQAISAACFGQALLIVKERWTSERSARSIRYFVDMELSSTLTTLARHLRFLNTPAVAASMQKSSFDPADLNKGRMSIFLILPPERMRAQFPLLRLWIGSLLRAVVRGGLQQKRRVHFVLDEAASLGHLDCIDDAIDKLRGYGVRLQLYFQSPAHTQQDFPNGQDVTLLSNTNQIYFSVNDFQTAEQVSKRLGQIDHRADVGRDEQQSLQHPHPAVSPARLNQQRHHLFTQ